MRKGQRTRLDELELENTRLKQAFADLYPKATEVAVYMAAQSAVLQVMHDRLPRDDQCRIANGLDAAIRAGKSLVAKLVRVKS